MRLDMNSHIIITAALGVPLSTGPSTILFDIWFLFYITQNRYIIKILTMYFYVCIVHTYIYVLLCVLSKDKSINQSSFNVIS